MRVLLAQNMPHVPAYGGANRSNRIMLEQLAALGHDCHVVAPGTGPAAYELNGVHGQAISSGSQLVRTVIRSIRELQPDRVLVPSDDPGALMLGAALLAAPDRVVYLAHTLQQLPFGPGAWYPSDANTRLVQQCSGVVAVSRAAQRYLYRWGGLDARLIYPAVYGDGPYKRHTGDAVCMVNPCAYKGIDILLALADGFPRQPFRAVATWGTTAEDRRLLAARANIEVVEPVEDIDDVFQHARVLLAPSLWDETFGYTVVEAMLRGIPVLASDIGGLGEAKLDVPYLLPVNPIQVYDTASNLGRPVPEIPPQDLSPWRAALDRLLTDDAHHTDVADRSQAAAARFVEGLDPTALDRYLRELDI